MRTTVTAVCAFSMLVSTWLFVMFLILRHPGYEVRAAASLGFVAIGLVTLASVWLPRPGAALRVAAIAGAIMLGAAGVWAMKTNVDEGFVDVVGLTFIVQALVTIGYVWQ